MRPRPPHRAPRTGLALALTALAVLLPVATAAGATLGPVPGGVGVAWGAWVTETVDDVDAFGYTSVVLDEDDVPHVAYTGRQSWMYATQAADGIGWQVSTIDEDGGTTGGGLVLDSEGKIHTAYVTVDGAVRVTYAALQADGSWEREVIGALGSRDPVIAVDSQDRVNIAYLNVGSERVKLAVQDGQGGWTTETIFQAGTLGTPSLDMALDSQDRVHVVIEDWDEPNARFHHLVGTPGGAWVDTALDGCVFHFALAVDSQDRAWIACHGSGPRGLMAFHFDGDSWVTWRVDDGSQALEWPRDPAQVGAEPSIAVDQQDRVHVVYRHQTGSFGDDLLRPSAPHYAVFAHGEWLVERLDWDGNQNGRDPDVAVDSQGYPHVTSVLSRRFVDRSCGDMLNECNDLRYYRPVEGAVVGSLLGLAS